MTTENDVIDFAASYRKYDNGYVDYDISRDEIKVYTESPEPIHEEGFDFWGTKVHYTGEEDEATVYCHVFFAENYNEI